MKSISSFSSRLAATFAGLLSVFLLLVVSPARVSAEAVPDLAELAKTMQALQAQVANLESRLEDAEARAAAAEKVASEATATASRANVAAAEATETASQATVAAARSESYVTDAMGSGKDVDFSEAAMAPAEDGWWTRTTLGGYGEMHLNLGDKEEIDFHRWVLFLGHEFNERVRLFSEIELEHSIAGDGKNGEIELEQAYLEFDLWDHTSMKAGLFIIPVGILNEVHEPNTFFGVERNVIEKEIIPTTWWEGGLAFQHRMDSGLSFDFATHSALDVPTTGSNAYRIRSGRQKVSEAPADAWAFTGRARYTGIPGLELASTVQYQTDITQSDSEKNRAVLTEAHADWRNGPWGFRVLGGYWDIGGESPAALNLSKQWGYYAEPSYRWQTGFGDFGIYGRWGQLKAETGKGNVVSGGLNYWPIPQAVFKFDYARRDDDGKEETWNFGVGYAF